LDWDVFCKALVKENVQDFIDYFAPGAVFVRFIEGQLQTLVVGPFDPREIRCDLVVEVRRGRRRFIIHVEFQSTKNGKMARRVLGYGFELERDHHLMAYSVVMYTEHFKKLPSPVVKWRIPLHPEQEDQECLHFEHGVLDVCNMPIEEFRKLDKDGFRPLMLLCEGGATTKVLDEVLEALREHKRPEALAVAMTFASRVFKSKQDLDHLERKRTMLDPILKKTWLYRKLWEEVDEEKIAKSLAAGHEKGLKEGREEGREEEARLTIERFVEKRSPTMLTWVKAQVQQINDLPTLQQILDTLFTASTPDEIKAAFPVHS